MAVPAITNGTEHFGVVTWTGNNSSPRAITGVGHQPDFIWIKDRIAANNHVLVDTSKGLSTLLYSNANVAGVTGATQVSSSNSDGFTLGATTYVNESGSSNTYVAWNWKANGGTTASSTNSTVQVNSTAKFSIVQYNGTGSDQTIGHGLGVKPDAIWIKNVVQNSATGSGVAWRNWQKDIISLSGDANTYYRFDSDDSHTAGGDSWGDTAPTSSVFTVGADVHTNASVSGGTAQYIAYCFANVDGFFKTGRYVGNSSTDGTMVNTGFKPALVMIKAYNLGVSWYMFDNKRNSFNPSGKRLVADGTFVEDAGTTEALDFLSNGFKLRNTSAGTNGGYTYTYYAWAENPFVGDGTNPVTAR